jgi:hypothetical protein
MRDEDVVGAIAVLLLVAAIGACLRHPWTVTKRRRPGSDAQSPDRRSSRVRPDVERDQFGKPQVREGVRVFR